MVCRQSHRQVFHPLSFACVPVLLPCLSVACLSPVCLCLYVCVYWAWLVGCLLLPKHLHTCFRSAPLLNKLLQYLNPVPHSTLLLASPAIVCLCSRFIFSCLPEPCVAQLLYIGYKLQPTLFVLPVWFGPLLPIQAPTSGHHS